MRLRGRTCLGWAGQRTADPHPGEPGAELGGWARRGCRRPAADPVERRAEAIDGRLVELREDVPDDPCAIAIAIVGRGRDLGLEGSEGGVAIDREELPIRPRERFLHLGLDVAHEQGEDREGVGGDRAAAIRHPSFERHDRDRGADETALPARRGDDQLLELGPAVRLTEDAVRHRAGEAVDGDPVTRLLARPPQELPGALRLLDERPVEEAEGEPTDLQLGFVEEAIREREQERGMVALRRRPEAASDRRLERRADTERRTYPWRDALLAGSVLVVGELRQPRSQGGHERLRILGDPAELAAEPLRARGAVGHERAGTERDLARHRRRGHRPAPTGRSGTTGAAVSPASLGRIR